MRPTRWAIVILSKFDVSSAFTSRLIILWSKLKRVLYWYNTLACIYTKVLNLAIIHCRKYCHDIFSLTCNPFPLLLCGWVFYYLQIEKWLHPNNLIRLWPVVSWKVDALCQVWRVRMDSVKSFQIPQLLDSNSFDLSFQDARLSCEFQ